MPNRIKQLVESKPFHRAIVAVIVLAGVMDKFHYLKIGLGVVLSFVGVKMILAHTAWKIDTLVSLGVIVLILATSVVWSLVKPKRSGRFISPTGLAAQHSGKDS